MELVFTKRVGKADDLLIRREGVPEARIPCPKQGIIPHDMVHYAVESTLARGGFLSMVRDGAAAAFETLGGEDEEAVERLVEVFQAEMWGGRIPAAELIATYVHACGARGHAVLPIADEQVEAIRVRLDELTADWAELPFNGSLSLRF